MSDRESPCGDCQQCQEQPIEYELAVIDDSEMDSIKLCQSCFYREVETITNDGIVTLDSSDYTYEVTEVE